MSAIVVKEEHDKLYSIYTIFNDSLGFLYELTKVNGSYSIQTVNVSDKGVVSKIDSTVEDKDLLFMINLTLDENKPAKGLIKETKTFYYLVRE